MIVLAIDAASPDASIALFRDEKLLGEHGFCSRRDLAAQLVPGIGFLLRSHSLEAARVDLFGVTVGPGLFTGIRVGLATLKGLNFPAARPMVAVNTLEALAAPSAESGRLTAAVIDAGRDEVYLGAYGFEEGQMRERLAPRLARSADAPELLRALEGCTLVGSGVERHADLLAAGVPRGRRSRRGRFLAVDVGRLALRRFRRGLFVTDLQALVPAYLRRPDAERDRTRPGAG
ncbi:MAG: tRNA (adenosine(37)-N6)-threonylcarbamoyltransferase complex dimerization subunit type 1 TsaB [Candidatus Aminicenantes bacterium]|nr:tRNA (adenosine(37)-N6)-threonylcarbamoyltransferase complex dimerization subunit type 1 TsaB [Candidatus Aminicenantes bacterium]